MKQKQVTCICSAYNFPHKIGGGKCNGSEWAESYIENYGVQCKTCNCMNRNICEVSVGQESIKLCEAYKHYLHSNISEKLPLDLEDKIDSMEKYYYEGLNNG